MTEPDVKGDGSKGTAAPWLAEIEASRKERRNWLERCRKINKLYRNERSISDSGVRRFSLLWSNIQTLQPAVYARVPQAVVSRRFRDNDPVARQASEVLERGLNYSLSDDDFDAMMRAVRDSYLLYAFGTCWVRYEPQTETIEPQIGVYEEPLQSMMTGVGPEQRYIREDTREPVGADTPIERNDDGTAYITGDTYESIKAEHVRFDYVHRDDFFHSPARTWPEVWWVGRAAYLTRAELIDRFGEEVGRTVTLDHKPVEAAEGDTENYKATVYEIWSKRDRKVFFVAQGAPDVLEEQEPFLDLSTFWPCPKPAFGTLTDDNLIPTPDYVLYQDQAETINDLIARIAEIQKQIRLAGFFPAGPSGDGSAAVAKAFTDDHTSVKLIPIPGWASFTEKGGANSIVWVPIDKAAQALSVLEAELEREIARTYQITGISDIVRGDTNPNETATAQGIKSQWGSLRIRDRQQELARFARDTIQIAGEVIAEKFQPETLAKMTGVPLAGDDELQMAVAQGNPQAIQQAEAMQAVVDLIRDDVSRSFRIEIESDSTIQPNEDEEKQARIEFLTAVGTFLGQAQQLLMVPGGQLLAPLIGQMLLFGVRGFRVGRELEEVIEQTMQQVVQAMSQPQQGNEQAQQAMQMEMEARQAEQQMKLEATQAQSQAKIMGAQADMAKTQASTQAAVIKNQSDIERMQAEASMRMINGGVQ